MCVLTQTNEEALIIDALLRRNGINSQLSQSIGNLRFANLAEIKYFFKKIGSLCDTSLIPDEIWGLAKEKTLSKYANSTAIAYVKRCWDQFEKTNNAKYVNDFRDFVFESFVEDFCDVDARGVFISTIHKAKGKEFDDVFMLVSDTNRKGMDDNLMRRYYVGMTRAKKRLFIHTNSDIFNDMDVDGYSIDDKEYSLPEEVVLQTTYRDVNLDYFIDKKNDVLALNAGDSLKSDGVYLYIPATNKPIALLSKKMQQELLGWKEKEYRIKSVTVSFVVAWKPHDAPKSDPHVAIFLSKLVLSNKLQ